MTSTKTKCQPKYQVMDYLGNVFTKGISKAEAEEYIRNDKGNYKLFARDTRD